MPYEMTLQHCAWLNDEGKKIAVVIIQAERVGDRITVGYRFVAGGWGVCSLAELELLAEPPPGFYDCCEMPNHTAEPASPSRGGSS